MITEEIRWVVYMRAHGRCEVVIGGKRCNRQLEWDGPNKGEAAHRVARSKPMIRKYGIGRIDHPMNLVWACPEHNSAVLITFNPIEREKLMKEIAMEMADGN